jgi:hypothetical protein
MRLTGKSAKSVSSPVAKNIPLYRFLETSLEAAPSCSKRGALRTSRSAVRDAMDAAASGPPMAGQTNGADADGKVVWS